MQNICVLLKENLKLSIENVEIENNSSIKRKALTFPKYINLFHIFMDFREEWRRRENYKHQ